MNDNEILRIIKESIKMNGNLRTKEERHELLRSLYETGIMKTIDGSDFGSMIFEILDPECEY